MSVNDLALLVVVGLLAGTYAKSEGANSLLAAVIGVAAAVAVYLVAPKLT